MKDKNKATTNNKTNITNINYNHNANNTNTHIKPEVRNINKLWTTVKELTNNCTKTPPRKIIHENSIITSLRKISNIASNHFINKIIKIRIKFETKHNQSHSNSRTINHKTKM